jgi:hypothetical protein
LHFLPILPLPGEREYSKRDGVARQGPAYPRGINNPNVTLWSLATVTVRPILPQVIVGFVWCVVLPSRPFVLSKNKEI